MLAGPFPDVSRSFNNGCKLEQESSDAEDQSTPPAASAVPAAGCAVKKLGMQTWLPVSNTYPGPWTAAGLFKLMVAFRKACGAAASVWFTLICPEDARLPAYENLYEMACCSPH